MLRQLSLLVLIVIFIFLGSCNSIKYPCKINIPENEEPVEIAVGAYHTCVRTNLNNAYCWGVNDSGQLGVETNDKTIIKPQLVKGGHQFKSLAAGQYFSCGATARGYFCWGSNASGELGQELVDGRDQYGNEPGDMSVPLYLTKLKQPISQFVLGGRHGCALSESGQLQCFGNYSFSAASHQFEIISIGPANAQIIGIGAGVAAGSTSILVQENSVNSLYQYGALTPAIELSADKPVDLSPVIKSAANEKPIQMSVSQDYFCVLIEPDDGPNKIACMGILKEENRYDILGFKKSEEQRINMGSFYVYGGIVDLPEGFSPLSLTLGSSHACSLLESFDTQQKKVVCWGLNEFGQLGLGIKDTWSQPKISEFGDDFEPISVQAGSDHTCVLGIVPSENKNHVKCFGYNKFGQLGIGDTNNKGLKESDMGDNLRSAF